MSILMAVFGGIFGRMVLTSLGATLLGLNVPPEMASKIVDLVQAFGPVGGPIAGLVVIAATFGWSFWQKKRSGVIPPK